MLRAALRWTLRFFGRVEAVGDEHLGDGGCLLVSNHVGWADPIWIAYVCYPRVLHADGRRGTVALTAELDRAIQALANSAERKAALLR